jgi:hypothetical protein
LTPFHAWDLPALAERYNEPVKRRLSPVSPAKPPGLPRVPQEKLGEVNGARKPLPDVLHGSPMAGINQEQDRVVAAVRNQAAPARFRIAHSNIGVLLDGLQGLVVQPAQQ